MTKPISRVLFTWLSICAKCRHNGWSHLLTKNTPSRRISFFETKRCCIG